MIASKKRATNLPSQTALEVAFEVAFDLELVHKNSALILEASHIVDFVVVVKKGLANVHSNCHSKGVHVKHTAP